MQINLIVKIYKYLKNRLNKAMQKQKTIFT